MFEVRIIDVILDLRKDSSSYGVVCSVELDSKTYGYVYIPEGCATWISSSNYTILNYNIATQHFTNLIMRLELIYNDPELSNRVAITIIKFIP